MDQAQTSLPTDALHAEGSGDVAEVVAHAAAAPIITFADGLTAVPTKFNFKSRTIKDAEGKEIAKIKQPSLEVALPVPTANVLADILLSPDVLQEVQEDGVTVKEKPNNIKSLVLDAVFQLIRREAQGQLTEAIESFGADATRVVSVGNLDYDKLTLEYIASIEPESRGGVTIDDETWKEFGLDYTNVMVVATGRPKEKVLNAVDVYMRPNKVKSRKDLLPMFLELLAVYAGHTKRLDDFADCVDYLTKRFTKFMKEDDKLSADAF
jgi:hypothetical protein